MALNTGMYLFEKNQDESKSEVHELFIKSIISGRKGLWITKSNPMELRSRHGFVSTVIIDLNEYTVSSEGRKRLDKGLFDIVEQFLDRYKSMAIIVEDCDDLIKDSFVDFLGLMSLVSSSFISSDIVFFLVCEAKENKDRISVLKKDYEFIKL